MFLQGERISNAVQHLRQQFNTYQPPQLSRTQSQSELHAPIQTNYQSTTTQSQCHYIPCQPCYQCCCRPCQPQPNPCNPCDPCGQQQIIVIPARSQTRIKKKKVYEKEVEEIQMPRRREKRHYQLPAPVSIDFHIPEFRSQPEQQRVIEVVLPKQKKREVVKTIEVPVIKEVIKQVPYPVEKIVQVPIEHPPQIVYKTKYKDKIVEVPVIKEVIKEVPRETIKEVIKEVPVYRDKIVEKEVPVYRDKIVEKIVELPPKIIKEVVEKIVEVPIHYPPEIRYVDHVVVEKVPHFVEPKIFVEHYPQVERYPLVGHQPLVEHYPLVDRIPFQSEYIEEQYPIDVDHRYWEDRYNHNRIPNGYLHEKRFSGGQYFQPHDHFDNWNVLHRLPHQNKPRYF